MEYFRFLVCSGIIMACLMIGFGFGMLHMEFKNKRTMEVENKMIERKAWKEFREAGLLWFVNTILHTFGWAIVLNKSDDGEITEAYPARVKFRGFPEESNTKGYNAVAKYLKENIDNIMIENEENEDA